MYCEFQVLFSETLNHVGHFTNLYPLYDNKYWPVNKSILGQQLQIWQSASQNYDYN